MQPRPTPQQLRQWDRQLVWHPFTQMAEYEPLIIERAQGCTLTDIDGNQYIDGVSSLWCNIHGHRHPRLDEALKRQIEQVAHVTSLGLSHPVTIELAKRLTDMAPPGLGHVFFSDDGATAVEVALKMAFQFWRQCEQPRPEKTRFMAFEQAYHGDTLGSVSVGGVARFHDMFRPLLFDVIRLPVPDSYRRPAGISRLEAGPYYLKLVERALQEHHREVAALVIEPLIQAAAGFIAHPEGFLRGVRELTRRFDVLLIADEVAVGMGRTGTLFACEHEKVVPDFLCLAKGLTAGYLPLAATLTTDRVWQAFLGTYAESKTFFHGHTYSGNPLGAAVALANLDLFQSEQIFNKLPLKVLALRQLLQRIAKHPHVGDVRQRGLIGAIELVRNRDTKEPFPWEEQRGIQVCRVAREHGVWLRPLGNVLIIMPPLSISTGELEQIAYAIEVGIEQTLSS